MEDVTHANDPAPFVRLFARYLHRELVAVTLARDERPVAGDAIRPVQYLRQLTRMHEHASHLGCLPHATKPANQARCRAPAR